MDFTLQDMLPLSGAIQGTSVGWMLFDAHLVLRDLNPAARSLMTLSRDEMLGRTLADLPWTAYADDHDPVTYERRPIVQALRTGRPVVNTLLQLCATSGATRWMMTNTYPVVIDGVVQAVASSYADVTESIVAREQLTLLVAIGRLARHADSRDAYLGQLCDTLVTLGDYALAVITSGTRDATTVVASAGLSQEFQRMLSTADPRMLSGDAFAGQATRSRTTQVVNDLLTDPAMAHWRTTAQSLQVRSAIAIPFTLEGEDLLLSVYSNINRHFNDLVVTALEEMTEEIIQGLSHVNANNELRRAYLGTMAALTASSEVRDPYTAGHQRNVGRLGAALATRLDLEASLVSLIDQAGGLHDIGKIAIPAEILTRPGRLNAIEFEMLQTHCVVGYDILTTAGLPWPIPEVALQHHERLDGSGYPHGRRGDDITLPARIIAVADVVEAMAHHRPYRAALGIDQALAEIARGAGTLYDAAVAAACQEVFAEGFTFTEAPTPGALVGVGARAS